MPKALFVEIEAKSGSEGEIADFLRNALDAAEHEPDTRDWYALSFGENRFAIFDTFDGNIGRMKHLAGRIGRGLAVKTMSTLTGLPDLSSSDILAAKLPTSAVQPKFAVYIPIETKLGQGRDLGEVLIGAKRMVDADPNMAAWYALRSGPNNFAAVEFFATEAARTAHLQGPIITGLKQLAGRHLETVPELRNAEVLASKQSGWASMAQAEKELHPSQPSRLAPTAPGTGFRR